MLRIKALGSLTIVGDAGPLMGAAAQPRRLALLALLARAGERGLTRDKIIACLWPDADEERGRANLSKVLYAVRQDLGDEVIVGSKDLRLNAGVVTSDLAEFERAVADGALEQAAAMYEGPFLDGFRLPGTTEFDRWADTERSTLRHEYEAVLERLAKRKGDDGDPAASARWWRTLAAQDPLNARHALGLMRALDASGDRAGAIQHARIYEQLVQQELDLPPDREVVALARRLRDAPAPERPPPNGAGVREPSPVATENRTPDPLPPAIADAFPAPEPPPPIATRDALAPPPIATRDPLRRLPRRSLRRAATLPTLAVVAALAVVLALRFRARSSSADVPVIALGRITDYRQATGTELARPLTDMLATSLGRLSGTRAVSTARMYELLSQAGGGADTSAAAMVTAARRAGATELVDGALYAVDGDRLRLDLRRVDLASGSVLAAYSVTGGTLVELADSSTTRLASDLRAALPTGSVADVTTESAAAYRLYEQGLREYYRGDVRTAERFFETALAEDSTFAMAAYYSALAVQSDRRRMLDRLARAARLARRATDRERLTILAQLTYARDEPSLRAIAETLVVRYPQEVDGYFFLGVSLVDSGAFQAGLGPLNRVVAMDSLALAGARARCVACDAMQAIVTAYQFSDSQAAVERETRRWLRLQPRSAAAWRTLAYAVQQRGRSAEALAAWRTEAEIDPPSVVTELADAAYRRIFAGDYDLAEQDLLGRLKGVVPSQEAEAHWYLALTYRQQGRLTEALTEARRYRTLTGLAATGNTAPHEALHEAQVLFEMQRLRSSAALFDSVARWWRTADEVPAHLARYQAWAMTHAANALAALGDTANMPVRADSVRALGAQSRFGRDRRLHHHVRGLLLAARGCDDDAIAELRQAIHSPNTGYTRTNYELARLYLRRGRARDAVAVLQPALRGSIEASNLYVTRTELHELLAQAWEAAGGDAARDSAVAHWAEVSRAWRRADPLILPRAQRAAERLATLRRGRPGAR